MTGKSQGMPKCGKLVDVIRRRASNMQMWENPRALGPKGAHVRASGGPRSSSSSTNSPASQAQHSPLRSLAQAPGGPGTLRQLFPKDMGACGGRAVSTLADGKLAVRAVLSRRKPTSPRHRRRKSYLHPRQACFCTSTPQNQVKEGM